MKYIRGQDGCIYSVSKLTPPCETHLEDDTLWLMRVTTTCGHDCTYATYSTEKDAILAYGTMTSFMTSQSVMIKFGLGVNSLPDVTALAVEAAERVLDQLDEAIAQYDSTMCEDCGCRKGERHLPGCDSFGSIHMGNGRLDEPTMVVAPIEPRPWLEIPASALTPWWRYLWPRSRKEKANDE